MLDYIPTPQDEETRLMPRAQITSTTNGTAYDMGVNFSAGGPGLPTGCVINITALDRTTGDETYAAKLQESSDGSNWFDICLPVSRTGTGVFSLFGFVNRRYVRLVETLGGTTPIVTREAWLNFNLGL